MGDCIGHEPCPKCGSRNNLARYADGGAHCFSFGCDHWEPSSDAPVTRRRVDDFGETETPQFLRGEYKDIPNRGLDKETCRKWRYEIGEGCHIANYYDPNGALLYQKLRKKGKEFPKIGPAKNPPFYGQWLWSGKGKSLTITEGELDALSVAQAWDNKWPVVSLPDGCPSAEKTVKAQYEWLCGFDKIVLMFDQDEPGQKCAEATAALLPPGKVFIAKLPRKDANEVLINEGPGAIVSAFWEAKRWMPQGIISGAEFTVDKLKQAVAKGYPLPYPKLQQKMLGLRKGELTLLTAGSGVGKSTWARELAYYLHQECGCSIGNVFLEEGNAKTGQAYVAIHNNVPLGRLRYDPDILTEAQWQDAVEKVVNQRMWFFNHFGSLESDLLLQKLRYLAVICGVDFIVLDHISIVVSGQEGSGQGERRDIDMLMTKLRQLIEETGVGILGIVHLNQPEGTPHEEGGRVTLRNLRGSGALKQLSDNVLALERDQQAEDEAARDVSTARVLKCRETGETGPADSLAYQRDTGRFLIEPLPTL